MFQSEVSTISFADLAEKQDKENRRKTLSTKFPMVNNRRSFDDRRRSTSHYNLRLNVRPWLNDESFEENSESSQNLQKNLIKNSPKSNKFEIQDPKFGSSPISGTPNTASLSDPAADELPMPPFEKLKIVSPQRSEDKKKKIEESE